MCFAKHNLRDTIGVGKHLDFYFENVAGDTYGRGGSVVNFIHLNFNNLF